LYQLDTKFSIHLVDLLVNRGASSSNKHHGLLTIKKTNLSLELNQFYPYGAKVNGTPPGKVMVVTPFSTPPGKDISDQRAGSKV